MVYIDLAVLGKSVYAVSSICENHTVTLTPVNKSISEFKSLFFENDSFCICNGSTSTTFNQVIYNTPSQGYYATVGDTLVLYECILAYALYDLNLSECSISNIALIELRKELTNLTLCSLDVISSARLSSIIDTIVVGNTFVISAVFTNKNACVKPVIIKFQYHIYNPESIFTA